MSYKSISKNKVRHFVPKRAPQYDAQIPCGCQLRRQQNFCWIRCDNNQQNIQCNDLNCKNGKYCRNRMFTRPLKRSLKIIETQGKGKGLITLQEIKENQLVVEYVGEVYSRKTLYGRQRYEENLRDGQLYMLQLDVKDKSVIDARKFGNISRFINHSCQPNCYSQHWEVNGIYRMGIFAERNIQKFEELSYSYSNNFWSIKDLTCLCGTKSCIHRQKIQQERIKNEKILKERIEELRDQKTTIGKQEKQKQKHQEKENQDQKLDERHQQKTQQDKMFYLDSTVVIQKNIEANE